MRTRHTEGQFPTVNRTGRFPHLSERDIGRALWPEHGAQRAFVFSALIGLGVGLALLYRNRFPRPRLFLLAACLAVVFEHATNNVLAIPGHNAMLDVLAPLTFGGLLCTLLLIAGIGYVLYLERQSIGAVAFRPQEWLRIPAVESQRRGRLFAKAQQATPLLASPTPEIVV